MLPRTEEHNKSYSNPDNDPKGFWRTGDVRNSLYRPNLIYDIITPSGKTISPPENGWRWSRETLNQKIEDGEIIFSEDETRIIRKIYLEDQEGRIPETIWFSKEVGSSRSGNSELKNLFNTVLFSTIKPTKLLEVMNILSGNSEITLDYFAGSGTTAHAVINLNREDDGQRKYILVEMGDYFDTVLKPRIQKVVYAQNWKDGKPKERDSGISHCFKYLRLESYEDTLNNLELNPINSQFLRDNQQLQREYLLHYLLDIETKGSQSPD